MDLTPDYHETLLIFINMRVNTGNFYLSSHSLNICAFKKITELSVFSPRSILLLILVLKY